jgi:hypothetical protein
MTCTLSALCLATPANLFLLWNISTVKIYNK